MDGRIVAAVLALAAGGAQAQAPPRGFVMGPPDAGAPAPAGEALAKNRDALVVRRLWAQDAVRLAADVARPGADGGKEPWAARDLVLMPVPGAAGLYCSEAKMRGLMLAARCLADADGDGRFERGEPMACADGPFTGWMMKAGGPVCALLPDPLARGFALAAPVDYTRVDPAAEGPQAWLNLRFESNYSKARPERPVKVTLTWVAAMKPGFTGSIHNGAPRTFDLPPGGVGRLDLDGGGVIETLGFAPDGRLRYRIAAEPAGGPLDIFPWRAPRVITIVLP